MNDSVPSIVEKALENRSLWTRSSNERARRLYEGRGYRLTGDVKQLSGGEEILRYELQLGDRM